MLYCIIGSGDLTTVSKHLGLDLATHMNVHDITRLISHVRQIALPALIETFFMNSTKQTNSKKITFCKFIHCLILFYLAIISFHTGIKTLAFTSLIYPLGTHISVLQNQKFISSSFSCVLISHNFYKKIIENQVNLPYSFRIKELHIKKKKKLIFSLY